MGNRMKLLPRYLKTFGAFAGCRIFIAAELIEEGISLPGIAFPFRLRKGTSDLLVFREVFLFKTYHIELDKPALIIDAGANIGLTSIYFSNRFPDARIIA